VSTYELGRQSFGLASACAWLRKTGATVYSVDPLLQKFDENDFVNIDLVAFYSPMHTATRIASLIAPRIREINESV